MENPRLTEKMSADDSLELTVTYIFGKKKAKEINKKIAKIILILFAFIALVVISLFLGKLKSINVFTDQKIIEHKRVVLMGYGAVGKTTFPLFLENFPFIKEYVVIDKINYTKKDFPKLPEGIKLSILHKNYSRNQLYEGFTDIVQDNDIVIALAGRIETYEILRALNNFKNIIYADASLENDPTNLRDSEASLIKELEGFKKKNNPQITGYYDAGANPGMITHFAIMGIYSMAKSAINRKVKDYKIIQKYLNEKNVKKLAEILQVDTIHISEMDSLEPYQPEKFDYKSVVVNTWCVSSFLEEWTMSSEVSAGSQDKKFFERNGYRKINDIFPEIIILPYPRYSKTTSPFSVFTGKHVTHPETIEIANVFSSFDHPITVAFVFRPSRLTRQTLENKNWKELPMVIIDEKHYGPLSGNETMGATLISSRPDIPIRWYGSVVTAQQSRDFKNDINPTTLQVAAGLYSHVAYALKNENHKLTAPHEADSEEIMKLAKKYLGTIWDVDLAWRLPTKYDELLSTKEEMDYDLI